ncbi:MAG: spore coat protein CotJB [Clostridia bacterium]|nr:spore coat protein CotJB [Clostridia bacterium]
MGCEDNNMTRQMLMQKIMEYKFAINDMALFLDTHPCDEKALKYHNEYVCEFKKLKEQYENEYGPLSIEAEVESWDKWVFEKWPWEGEVK